MDLCRYVLSLAESFNLNVIRCGDKVGPNDGFGHVKLLQTQRRYSFFILLVFPADIFYVYVLPI